MKWEVVIIGGGVGGLSAAIECCSKGMAPLVVEAGTYPTQKVCGEFLSSEALSFLQKCHIFPELILQSRFYIGSKQFDFPLPFPAGSLSHGTLDPALAAHARSLGTKIYTHVKVESFIPKAATTKQHILELSTGEVLHANTVVVAVGRLPFLSSPTKKFKYLGIKAHLAGLSLNSTLEMFGLPGAYLGLSPIEEGKTNLACLASMSAVSKWRSIPEFMKQLINQNSRLEALFSKGIHLSDEWMQAPVPFFGFKSTPDWEDVYFIGDAAMSLPPACGGGLSQSIASGRLAAGYIAKGDPAGFKKACKAQNAAVMRYAKFLHHALMTPRLGQSLMSVCKVFPSVADWLFKATRQSATF